jgi:hypothetical protein
MNKFLFENNISKKQNAQNIQEEINTNNNNAQIIANDSNPNTFVTVLTSSNANAYNEIHQINQESHHFSKIIDLDLNPHLNINQQKSQQEVEEEEDDDE